MTRDSIEGVAKTYGPYAFGVVSLLVIWVVIIGPQLEAHRLDFETHQSIVETSRDTALILDKVVSKLTASGLIGEVD